MKQIWKYPIGQLGVNLLEIPVGAQLLTVQTQNNAPQLWALVDPEAPKELIKIGVCGTGQPINVHVGIYLGTFQLSGGSLVFHAFTIDE